MFSAWSSQVRDRQTSHRVSSHLQEMEPLRISQAMLPLSSISAPKILSLQFLLKVCVVEPPTLLWVELPPHSRSYSYESLSLFCRVGSNPALVSAAAGADLAGAARDCRGPADRRHRLSRLQVRLGTEDTEKGGITSRGHGGSGITSRGRGGEGTEVRHVRENRH